jgi:hypothetical protein
LACRRHFFHINARTQIICHCASPFH